MSEWWRGAVIYQIYPRSFQDSNGDGVGDLEGITQRLDHVAALGADAIWLSPIFASPMADMGYDVSNYTEVDPVFGTLDDFDALMARAHELGLKVIIDQVVSHTSDQHPWFEDSRQSRDADKADWYVWADGNEDGTPPNNWLSVFGGSAWEWDTRRRQYYLHNFLTSQPDLNFHNMQVQDEVLNTMRFWLDRGVDGFRLDTVNFYVHDKYLRNNPHSPRLVTGTPNAPEVNPYGMQEAVYSKNRPENIDFLKRFRALLDEYNGRTSVGEVGDDHHAVSIMAEYTQGDDKLHMAYSFDMLGAQFTPGHFRSKIEQFFAASADGWPCWSFSNHDVIRHVTRWLEYGENQDAIARLAAAMLLSFEGSVCLYQGEELGLTETELQFDELTDPRGKRFWPEDKGRDGCRTPMVWDETENGGFTTGLPWLPVKPEQLARNVAAQRGKAESVLEFYRDMIRFRRETEELCTGKSRFLDLPEPVLGFERRLRDQVLLCLFNLSSTPQHVPLEIPCEPCGPGQGAEFSNSGIGLGANGFAFAKLRS